MTVADRIRETRERLGMSQETLAFKAGYSGKSAVCKIELSGNNVTLKKVTRMAKALGVTEAYLMGWEENLDNLSAETVVSFITEQDLQEHVQTLVKLNDAHKQRIYGMIEAFAMEEGIELVKIEFKELSN